MDWILFWTAAAAIGQLIAIPSFLFAGWIYFRELKSKHCDELGDSYALLLSHALAKPYLIHSFLCTTETQKLEYGIYAHMMWNFVETVVDRVGHDKKLFDTWLPVILCECRRHSEWFSDSDNKRLYKSSFCDRINVVLTDLKHNSSSTGQPDLDAPVNNANA
jgi:hypothetical protein